MRRLTFFLISAGVLVGTLTSGLFLEAAPGTPGQAGTNNGRTVWDGVYTTDQAARGQAAFATSCARCHMNDLSGASAASLKDERFMDRWREYNLEIIFNFIRTAMPPDFGNSNDGTRLTDDTYLDIFTYILQGNEFPTGDKELRTDVLDSIQLVGRDGPQPLPTGALALVVGCLARSGDDTWMLVNASPPIRAQTSPFNTTPEELAASEAQGLGPGTFGLKDIHYIRGLRPDDHEGHKMQAKGLLIRLPDSDRISLTSMEMVASDCAE